MKVLLGRSVLVGGCRLWNGEAHLQLLQLGEAIPAVQRVPQHMGQHILPKEKGGVSRESTYCQTRGGGWRWGSGESADKVK
jgi:hypothetical protein